MKLIHLIKLLQRYIILIILVPLFLAAIVYLFTRKQARNYLSETTIYTGITTGYSVQQETRVDLFASNTAYDNLINLIKSRRTMEEVSVRLLVQHLMLDHYDPKYIQQENYEELLAEIPPDIVQIVRKYKRNQKQQQYYRPPQKTSYFDDDESDYPTASPTVRDAGYQKISRNQPSQDYHVVRRGETMYSIAKQYRISIEKLMNLNDLQSYELATGQQIRVNDNFTPSTSADYPYPAPARQTGYDTTFGDDYERENDTTPLITKRWISIEPTTAHQELWDTTTPYERCVRELMRYGNSNDYNYIYKLWNSGNRFYSISALSAVTVTRIENSDLVTIRYVNPDPGICQQTLIILTKVFIRSYKELRQHQTDAVVAYFKRQLEEAMRRLQKAEYDLLVFNEKNKIINYYEQTKAIAGMKEQLDQQYSDAQIAYASADAAIKIIEKKLEAHAKLTLNTNAIIELRSELATVSMQIVNIEIDLGNDSATIKQLAALKSHSEYLKKEIRKQIDALYVINNSVEGLPVISLLNAWLTNVIAYEESKAAFRVLTERKKQFQRYYEIFAPLGAEMKRIERLIGVTEEEFLQLLHDLNLAKLRQQDDEMSTNIKVVDPPYYPLKPLKSRAMFLVIIAGLVGLVLIIAILIALEYFDTTVKTIERAERILNLKVAGIYPRISRKLQSADMEFIVPRLVEMLVQNVTLAVKEKREEHKKPIMVLFFSMLDGEGKTTVGRELCNKLQSFGEKVLYLNYYHMDPESTSPYFEDLSQPGITDNEIQYEIRNTFFDTQELETLIPGFDAYKQAEYDFIFVEIPSLINHPFPVEFVRMFDLSLLVIRANRSWKEADIVLLNAFKPLCKQEPQVILNGVELFFLDSVFGEVPKPRSEFRRMITRILLFRFRERSKV
ncbi:MAG: LysM peptidoglycan-binding domain-containing protein [Bacteroidales bacterium]|nr:LysM peptidoglycan-binding domain-containing protein [Bacteroidales bacterium]